MDAFSTVLNALGEKDVKFIVVGGVAVNAHGFQRFTHDLDLVIDLSKENIKCALEILSKLGFQPRIPADITDFLDETIRDRWIREKNMMVFSLVSAELNGLVVDIFAEEPFQFKETLAKSFRDDLGGGSDSQIAFLDLDSLIEMKEQTGRSIDLNDIAELRLLKDENQEREA